MANTGKIDPAFQTGTVLQDVYNPVELAREQHQEKFRRQEAEYYKKEKETSEGLNKLMVDLKGWEDNEGFRELTERNQRAADAFLALSRKGMNIVNPKSVQEVMAYKAISDYHAKTKQLADTWTQQKGMYDIIQKSMAEDAKLDPDDQRIDHSATQANLSRILSGKSIADRGTMMQDAIVAKPQIADVHKYVKENIDMITKPEKRQIAYTDPVTGEKGYRLTEETDPKTQKLIQKDLRSLYRSAPSKVKAGVELARKNDAANDPAMSSEDYFVTMYNPKFKEQMIEKSAAKGGGFSFNLGGSKVSVQPAQKSNNLIPLGNKNFPEHYDYNIDKTLIGVPVSNYKGAQVLEGNTWNPVSDNGGLVDAHLHFYDPTSDSFVFSATANSMDVGTFKGSAILIPRTSLGEEYSDLPIKDEKGKVVKIKNLHPEVVGAGTVLRSGISWKK